MPNLSSTVLVALGGALVVVGGYHVLFVAPRLAQLRRALATHDTLIGGDGGAASARLAELESGLAREAAATGDARRRVEALESAVAAKTPHIGFVRYNAFENTGSDLSYALALVTKNGDGVVISSIWSREETRTYGKAVTNFSAAQDTSNEERAAIAKARAAAS